MPDSQFENERNHRDNLPHEGMMIMELIATHEITYKCRMCGKTFVEGETNKENAVAAVCLLNQGVMPEIPIRKDSIHFCGDGSVGYADLLGLQIKVGDEE